MKMYKIKEVYTYTLKDLLGDYDTAYNTKNNYFNIFVNRSKLNKLNMIDTYNILFDSLFNEYVMPNYYNYVACVSDTELDFSLLPTEQYKSAYSVAMNNFKRKIIAFYNGTIKKYALLNSAFVNDLNSLLKAPITKIDSDTKGVDNDTPQSSLEGGLFNDIYASVTNHNIYHYENENDNQYYIDKITNLKAKWDDIMNEWASQFANDCLEGLEY